MSSKATRDVTANPAARPLLQCPVGLDEAYHSCCQQVRALETELAEVKTQCLAVEVQNDDLRNERDALKARDDFNQNLMALGAEKIDALKARVAELEVEIKKCPNVNWHLYEGKGMTTSGGRGRRKAE